MLRALVAVALGFAALFPTNAGAAEPGPASTVVPLPATATAANGGTGTAGETVQHEVVRIGDVVYVAGARDADGGPTGLAAFGSADGQLLDWFDADVRGGEVYRLVASPAGDRLFVAGDFTSIEGAADTAGLAALDPSTGRLDPSWRAGLDRPWGDDPAIGHDVAIHGEHLYVAGNFSHIGVGTATEPVSRLGRVDLESGRLDPSFRPLIGGGAVLDIHLGPDGERLYAVGSFTSVEGSSRFGAGFAVLVTRDGSLPADLDPPDAVTSSAGPHRAVLAVENLVFVAGSAHDLHVLEADTLARRHVYFTGSPSFVSERRLDGAADFVSLELIGDRVHALCDCFTYHLAAVGDDQKPLTLETATGRWTPVRGSAVYDAVTGAHLPAARPDPPTAVDDQRPTPPKGLVLDRATTTGVALRWTTSSDNVGVVAYTVHRATDSDAIGPIVATTQSPSFVDRNALPGVGYRYVVKAVDAAGNSSWRSNPVDVVVGSAEDLDRPTPPRGLRITNTSNGRITISWSASEDGGGPVTGYQVHRSTNGDAGPLVATTTGTSYTDGSVQPGAEYTYTVRAIDGVGNLSWRSNLSTGSLDEQPLDPERPTAPTGLRAESERGVVRLYWTESVDNIAVVTYRVHRSTDGGFGDVLETGLPGFTDDSVVAGRTYTYAVTALDDAGNVSWRSNLTTVLAA